MSILSTISENLPESVLEAVYALQQRRLQQIETEGVAVTLTSRSDCPTLKTIRDGDQWYFAPSSPVKVGSMLRDGSVVNGQFVVTETQEQAGRLAATMQHLPDSVSFFTGESRPADFGVNRVSLKATEWRGIPCARNGNKLTLPAAYTPTRGDILLIDGKHFTARSTRHDGPLVEVTLEPY